MNLETCAVYRLLIYGLMQSILFNSSLLLFINQYSVSLKVFLKVVVKGKDVKIHHFISHM